MKSEPEETRAQIARRRLAQLTEAFEAEFAPPDPDPDPDPEPDEPDPFISRPSSFAWRPQHLRVVGVAAAAGAVVVAWWLLSSRPHSADPAQPLAVATAPAVSAGATSELVVDVIGKVRRPGIVVLPAGSRVNDAVEAAGGFRGKVDARSINLARSLTDGEQILVGIEPADVSGAGLTSSSSLVSLNAASAEQLESLPGVGPVTAQSILAWRSANGSFASIDDLLDVKGIGPATLESLRDLVTL